MKAVLSGGGGRRLFLFWVTLSVALEKGMSEVEKYIQQFAKLRRAPSARFNEATRNRAPHKPLLLLALMDLIERGVISSNFISLDDDRVELNESGLNT
jgi:predicted restriction endonuclease